MNRKHFAFITIIFLCTVLGYQLIDLINYINEPKAISLDHQIETPEIITPEELNSDSKSQNDISKKTKPLQKEKFLKVHKISSEDIRFSKEDYEGQIKHPPTTPTMALEANWEKNVLESKSIVEKSLQKASLVQGQALPTNYDIQQKNMERFAIKIELPDANEGTKVKLQYREPPDFGKSTLPQPILPKTTPSDAVFSIEKTKTTESPWDNFSGPK